MKREAENFAYTMTSFIVVDIAILIAMAFVSVGCSNEGYQLAEFCANPNGTFSLGTNYKQTFFSPVPIVMGGVALSVANMLAVWAVDADHKFSLNFRYTNGQSAVLIVMPILEEIYIILMLSLAAGNGSLQLWFNYQMSAALAILWCVMITLRTIVQLIWVSLIVSRNKEKKNQ